MKKLLLSLAFMSSLCLPAISQKAPKGFINIKATTENFDKVMSFKDPNIKQIDTLIQMGRNYTQVNKDTALLLIDRAIELTKGNTEEKIWRNYHARAWSSKGAALSKYNDNDQFGEVMAIAREKFEAVPNPMGIASVERIMGLHYLDIGEWETATNHYLNSIQLYKKHLPDPRALIGPFEGLSKIYHNLGDYNKSLLYLSQAINITDTTDIVHLESSLRSHQADLLLEFGNDFLSKADTLPKQAAVYRDSAQLFFNRGLTQADLALKAAKELNDPTYIITSHLGLAKLYNQINKYSQAKSSALKARSLAEKMPDTLLMTRSYIQLATAMNGINEFQKAIPIAESALMMAQRKNINQAQLDGLELLTQLYISTDQSKKALAILADRKKQDKKLNSISTKKAVANAETKFQTAEKEKQIFKQENEILTLETTNAKIQRQKKYLMGGSLLFALLGFFGYQFNKIRKERNSKKEFAEALIFAQEEERKRIARDLHDGIGQSLLLIKKQMDITKDTSVENQKMIAETLEEVRSISQDLHPYYLEKLGLTASIENIIDKVGRTTNLFITKEIENIDNTIKSNSEINLFRTIQEAFNNIVKHAEANAAKITINKTATQINIQIQDNGKGFDHELKIVKSKSLGLRTMNERITSLNGNFKFNKGINSGTVIDISIPINR